MKRWVLVVVLLAACGDSEEPTAAPTTTAAAPSTSAGSSTEPPQTPTTFDNVEGACVAIRREWHASQTIREHTQLLGTHYREAGCEDRCGALVEDTDTPERETRCAYP